MELEVPLKKTILGNPNVYAKYGPAGPDGEPPNVLGFPNALFT